MIELIKYCGTLQITVIIILLSIGFFASPVLADQASAQSAIAAAQNSLKDCYRAAEQAEAIGANIDSLVATLNSAASLLSQAELAYASNDYNSAYTYATQSQDKLNGFISQATIITENGIKDNNQTFAMAQLSIIVTAVIVCLGIASWFALSRRERANLNGLSAV